MRDILIESAAQKPKLLLLEFWGLGDLTFTTPLLRAAQEKYAITLVGKAHAAPLLKPTFPEIEFHTFDAPWSAYLDKYALWRWPWRNLLRLMSRLRATHFDAAVSVRSDPRDHFFMWLLGAKKRYGFPRRGSAVFLTHPVERSREKQHKVEDWHDLAKALELPSANGGPRLDAGKYPSQQVNEWLAGITKPILCLHPGARIAVRRWPEEYFRQILTRMRAEFDFHLVLIPDPDGYGHGLAPLADTTLQHHIGIGELTTILSRADLLLCNDSGPGHIAAACDKPAIVIFGPTDADWFRPWGDQHHLVMRDICPWRPCFDYCKFPEPYCMTKNEPGHAWPEICAYIHKLMAQGRLTPRFAKP